MRLDGKVSIITGSTKGIGRRMAAMFADEGAGVVITGRTEEDGRSLAKEIAEAGGRATFVRADMADEQQVRGIIDHAVSEYGRLDVLVNNAAPIDFIVGAGGDGPVTELTTAALDQIMRVGIYGPVWACKYGIPEMIRTGGGSIINISSYSSNFGLPGVPAYSASKGALNALTRQIAADYGAKGIRSNAIIIGFIASGEMSQMLAAHPIVGKAYDEATLTRSGNPDDIAHAAIYLASDDSAFITGAMLPADGGLATRSAAPDFSALLGG